MGVILKQELPHLSHLGVRARQASLLSKYPFLINDFEVWTCKLSMSLIQLLFITGKGRLCHLWGWWKNCWYTKIYWVTCEVIIAKTIFPSMIVCLYESNQSFFVQIILVILWTDLRLCFPFSPFSLSNFSGWKHQLLVLIWSCPLLLTLMAIFPLKVLLMIVSLELRFLLSLLVESPDLIRYRMIKNFTPIYFWLCFDNFIFRNKLPVCWKWWHIEWNS